MSVQTTGNKSSSNQKVFSPLLQAIIEREKIRIVEAADLDELLADGGETVLFFPGDAVRIAESDDVAVILPELIKAYGGRLRAAVASREAERALQLRYRFNAFPALVFLKSAGPSGANYLGAVVRLRDWAGYLREIDAILARQPGEPPPFAFPEGRAVKSPDQGEGSVTA